MNHKQQRFALTLMAAQVLVVLAVLPNSVHAQTIDAGPSIVGDEDSGSSICHDIEVTRTKPRGLERETGFRCRIGDLQYPAVDVESG